MKESIIIYTACCLVALTMFCWGRYVGKNITSPADLCGTISGIVLAMFCIGFFNYYMLP